jgi:hypothetical protein
MGCSFFSVKRTLAHCVAGRVLGRALVLRVLRFVPSLLEGPAGHFLLASHGAGGFNYATDDDRASF